jgi:multidrug efflux pump
MKQINLSEWALRHQSMVLYLMIVFMVGGVISFFSLGRAEDPDFTFKVMVVRTLWPGANAQQVEQQLTERIEKKLAETPWVDVLRTASKPGESLTIVILKDYTPKTEVPEAWRQVRKKLDDIRHTLPAGVQGPFPNDEFGDVQIKIFALTSRDDKTGYTMGDLRREADKLARELRRVPDVKKIELIGVQDEKIYIDVSPARLAAMGLVPTQVFDALQRQNAVAPAGQVETETDRVRLRVTGPFDSVDAIRETMLAVGGRSFRLGDIARVSRGLVDPPQPRMRFAGRDAIGIGVVMARGGNVIDLGENLSKTMDRLQQDLPVGMDVHVVFDQPQIVKTSLNLFVRTLGEAMIIVLAVSFLSLGWRTGTVVALSIPLVLAMTFLAMKMFGIDLQRISLGRAGDRTGPAGRRRDHCRRNDGGENGAGLGPLQGGDFRLYLDRVPDADRHADYRGRLHPGGLRQVGRGRIHDLHFPGGDHFAADFLDCRRGLHALARLQAARPGEAARDRREARGRYL